MSGMRLFCSWGVGRSIWLCAWLCEASWLHIGCQETPGGVAGTAPLPHPQLPRDPLRVVVTPLTCVTDPAVVPESRRLGGEVRPHSTAKRVVIIIMIFIMIVCQW